MKYGKEVGIFQGTALYFGVPYEGGHIIVLKTKKTFIITGHAQSLSQGPATPSRDFVSAVTLARLVDLDHRSLQGQLLLSSS